MGKAFPTLCRLALALALPLFICLAPWLGIDAHAAEKPVRIGYQKYGTLVLLKESGKLDEQLKAQGITVEWREFPGGPQLLEALNVGALDFGIAGEAPPIFAQAAGAPFVYVGVEPPAPKGEAILVPKDSPLKTVADLKGKKVALNKGSNVHYLLVKALEEAGLSYSDIQPTYLAPADARAAFEQGSVDAWVIWDPYYAAAAAATQARVLVDGVRPDGSNRVANHQFYLAERSFYEARPQLVKTILAALTEVDAASRNNPKDVAQRLSPQIGIPAPVLETALARMGYGIQPMTPDVVADQQKIADTFHKLGLIPKPIKVSDAIPESKS